MSDDEFARARFRVAASMPEPVWSPDPVALLSRGRRRARIVNSAIGTGAVGLTLGVALLAVTAFGGGSTSGVGPGVQLPPVKPPVTSSAKSSAKPPVVPPAITTTSTPTVPPNGPPSKPKNRDDVLHFFDLGGQAGDTYAGAFTGPPTLDGRMIQPTTASVDATLYAVLTRLDPAGQHLRSTGDPTAVGTVVADSEQMAKQLQMRGATSFWTQDGRRPTIPLSTSTTATGVLDVGVYTPAILKDPNALGSTDDAAAACGLSYGNSALDDLLDPTATAPAQTKFTWSACTTTPLPDGSTVKVATAPAGPGTAVVGFREAPGGHGYVVIVATDWANPKGPKLATQPWTVSSITTALSDPGVTWTIDPAAG